MANTPGADLNELHCAFVLNGRSWNGKLGAKSKEEYDKRQEQLGKTTTGSDEARWRQGQAEKMAEEVVKWAKRNGFSGNITEVYWTARSDFNFTDIDAKWEEKSKDHPADVLIKFQRSTHSSTPSGNYLGISMKSLKATSGEAPVKNPGTQKISEFIGKSGIFDRILIKYLNEAHLQTGLPKKQKLLEASAVKDVWKPKDAEKKKSKVFKTLDDLKNKCLSECRDVLLQGFKDMDDGEVRLYILMDLLDTDKIPMYVKVTGYGTNNYRAAVEVPTGQNNQKFKALMDNTQRLTYEATGGEDGYSFGVKAGSKRIVRIRWKFSERPFSSGLKMSVEPWTTPGGVESD